MMVRFIPRDEAISLTTPFHALWMDAHEYARHTWWSDLLETDLFLASRPATRASALHDLVVRYIDMHGGEEMPGSRELGFYTQIIAGAPGTAVVRFKLLDVGYLTKNHRSGQQEALDSQDLTDAMLEQLSIAGFPGPATFLTCGYQLSSDEMSISNVAVVCHYQREVIYSYDLERTGGVRGVEVLNLPTPPPPPPIDVRSRRPSIEQPRLFEE